MDYQTAFRISAAGMHIEKLRMEVTALNIANMHTTAARIQDLYQPLRVVTRPATPAFHSQFGSLLSSSAAMPAAGVEPVAAAPRRVPDAGHPHADAQGMVAYPGVDHAMEMVNLNRALHAYEANVVAMNAARTMAARALEIGGQ